MLGWILDGTDDAESDVIQDLLYIAVTSRAVTSSIVSLSWVQDSIDNVEAEAVRWVNNIGSAEVALAVVSLGWVQDGIDEIEVKTIEEISYIDYEGPETASAVVSLGWVRDGISVVEAEAIAWMANMTSAETALAVVSLGWVQDGIDEIEVRTIEEISYIDYDDAAVAISVVSLGWVQDGIGDVEAQAIDWLTNIGSTEVASAVVSLGWVQDGISEVEVTAVEEISYIDYEDPEVASAVVLLSWVQDGIDVEDDEVDLIDDIASITDKDAGAVLRIVGMPFLETVEPPDVAAMSSLRQLAVFRPEAFASVLSHEALRDGISDELAPIVATLDGVAKTNPGLVDVLLDSSKVLLEQRAITLPLFW